MLKLKKLMLKRPINRTNKKLLTIFLTLNLIIIALIISILVVKHNQKLSYPDLLQECSEISSGEFVQCITNKSHLFYEQGDCDYALKIYDDASANITDKYILAQIYSYAIGTSLSCDDENNIKKWNQKMDNIMSDIEGVYYEK